MKITGNIKTQGCKPSGAGVLRVDVPLMMLYPVKHIHNIKMPGKQNSAYFNELFDGSTPTDLWRNTGKVHKTIIK